MLTADILLRAAEQIALDSEKEPDISAFSCWAVCAAAGESADDPYPGGPARQHYQRLLQLHGGGPGNGAEFNNMAIECGADEVSPFRTRANLARTLFLLLLIESNLYAE